MYENEVTHSPNPTFVFVRMCPQYRHKVIQGTVKGTSAGLRWLIVVTPLDHGKPKGEYIIDDPCRSEAREVDMGSIHDIAT